MLKQSLKSKMQSDEFPIIVKREQTQIDERPENLFSNPNDLCFTERYSSSKLKQEDPHDSPHFYKKGEEEETQ